MFLIRGFFSIVRLLFFFVLFTLIWKIIRMWLRRPAHASGNPQQAPPSTGASMITGKTVRDPVCGTYVATELAIPGPSGGAPVYFCSEECRRNYLLQKA